MISRNIFSVIFSFFHTVVCRPCYSHGIFVMYHYAFQQSLMHEITWKKLTNLVIVHTIAKHFHVFWKVDKISWLLWNFNFCIGTKDFLVFSYYFFEMFCCNGLQFYNGEKKKKHYDFSVSHFKLFFAHNL